MSLNNKVDDLQSYHDPSYDAWLLYTGIPEVEQYNYARFGTLIVNETSEVFDTAVEELQYGISRITGKTLKVELSASESHALVLGTISNSAFITSIIGEETATGLGKEGYVIRSLNHEGKEYMVLAGNTDKSCLYAVFHFLRFLQTGMDVSQVSVVEIPRNKIRMINHWDNMNGSIERGYAGNSIFYDNNDFVPNLSRIKDYARLLASVGINMISINNVNVHQVETLLVTDRFLPDVARFSDVFRRYGMKIFMSINFASPIELGGLATADPLDPEVQRWWAETAARIYHYIPDFGGFIVKADSEFRAGPFTYGREHTDGANMLAEVLEPYGGLVIWRCFVYNCTQDWRDRQTDRARAAFDHFTPLDGRFHNNVILQIKNGPMDFQVREPVSPLLGGLKETNQVLELQITQEYTGQQRHLCYLLPQWKEVLDFDTWCNGEGSTVAKVASGESYKRPYGGMAAVSNIGDDLNWTGHLLAQANLYGYGRLAWDPGVSVDSITNEWVTMTFGTEPEVVCPISNVLLRSWQIYEDYTAPLGVGWMVNPNHHYGPNVDGYEYSKWGTYHYADCKGIGVDRTVKTGTGYTAQYHAPQSDLYEEIETCPDELLLFFHHVPYTYRLKSGKTIIQHIYDTHFDGVEQAVELKGTWQGLRDKIDSERFEQVMERLQEQVEQAKEWRDVINTYFFRKSGIPDEKRRKIF